MYNRLFLYLNKVKFFSINNLIVFNAFEKNNFNFFSNKTFSFKITGTQNITIKKNLFFVFKYNNKYYYDHTKYNEIFYKKFCNVLSDLFCNKFNALILDSNYKVIAPLYNYIFGCKTLQLNKAFFFLSKKSLTLNNWIYIYRNNIKRFKVNLLIVSDYMYFKNFLSILKKFNLPILSLVPSKIEPIYIDYYLLINYMNLELSKLFLFNFFSSFFFKYDKFFLLKKKFLYLHKFSSFSKFFN